MRLRLEFTTEPFDLEETPGHARAARAVLADAGLDSVDVGPFGNTAEGSRQAVLAALDEVLRAGLDTGATRITLQVNVLAEEGT